MPAHKQRQFRFEADKFGAAGLTPVPATTVRPPRVLECPLQFEARAAQVRPDSTGSFVIVEAAVQAVHAAPELVVADSDHVDPQRWSPLIYNFRHYFGLGQELGNSFRSETAR